MRRIIRCCNNVVIPHDITDFIYLMIAVMYLSAPAERNLTALVGLKVINFI